MQARYRRVEIVSLVFGWVLAGCTSAAGPERTGSGPLLPWTIASDPPASKSSELLSSRNEATRGRLDRASASLEWRGLPPASPDGRARLNMAFREPCETCTVLWAAQSGRITRQDNKSADWIAPELSAAQRKTFRTRLLCQLESESGGLGWNALIDGIIFEVTLKPDGIPDVKRVPQHHREDIGNDEWQKLIDGISSTMLPPQGPGKAEQLRLTMDRAAVQPEMTWIWEITSGELAHEDRLTAVWSPPTPQPGQEHLFEAFLKCWLIHWGAGYVEARDADELNVTMTKEHRLEVTKGRMLHTEFEEDTDHTL